MLLLQVCDHYFADCSLFLYSEDEADINRTPSWSQLISKCLKRKAETASGPQAFLVFKFLNAIIFISFYSQPLDQLLSESLLDHIMSLQNKRISRSTSFTTCISFLPGFKSIICFTESLL